jgi:Mn2+/Fe2+ NRAMP family transporter
MFVFRDEAGVVESEETIIPLAVLLILIAAISFIAIFIYKNRKLQLMLSMVLILLSIILLIAVAVYVFILAGKNDAQLQFRINLIFPVVVLIFSILAHRGIKKDEELVKSYDRLR